jgi:hypothetical protein
MVNRDAERELGQVLSIKHREDDEVKWQTFTIDGFGEELECTISFWMPHRLRVEGTQSFDSINVTVGERVPRKEAVGIPCGPCASGSRSAISTKVAGAPREKCGGRVPV